MMRLNSEHLEAFYQLSQTRNFTQAAKRLGITQSALSQRIAKLEEELESGLMIREKKGITLTPSGETLLRYCQQNRSLESEVLSSLKSRGEQLAGTFRIAGYSSITRSVLIPALADFQKQHPHVQIHFSSKEVTDLQKTLQSGSADLIVADYDWQKNGILSQKLGQEEFVLIQPKSLRAPEVYLDHGPDDNATESFFRHQGKAFKAPRRGFMGDVYGILDGVELGYGKAVMSRHLLSSTNKIKIIPSQRKYFRPVNAFYFELPYYSKLHQEVLKALSQNAPQHLKTKRAALTSSPS